jgi:hypothetical protein
MRYTAAEKLEIIRLVGERIFGSSLTAKGAAMKIESGAALGSSGDHARTAGSPCGANR